MILIADSGSTKTEWRLVMENGEVQPFSTMGFNPYVQTGEQISFELKQKLAPEITSYIKGKEVQLFYYGAGCSTETNCTLVKNAILSVFPGSRIEIQHDLLAAARALCGKEEGIAAILGTGANTCYFDGSKIVKNIPALGYVLGDEGGGTYIGKKLIAALLYEEMPANLREKFYSTFKLNKESILEAIYKQPTPNRFLASFTPFVKENIQEVFFLELILTSFNEFFERHICKYPRHREMKMGCLGSVGYYFRDILAQVASAKGVQLGKVIRNPMNELVEYHRKD